MKAIHLTNQLFLSTYLSLFLNVEDTILFIMQLSVSEKHFEKNSSIVISLFIEDQDYLKMKTKKSIQQLFEIAAIVFFVA